MLGNLLSISLKFFINLENNKNIVLNFHGNDKIIKIFSEIDNKFSDIKN